MQTRIKWAMSRKGQRITIARGVYRDGTDGPYEVRVVGGGAPYAARMPPDSTLDELKQTRALESRPASM